MLRCDKCFGPVSSPGRTVTSDLGDPLGVVKFDLCDECGAALDRATAEAKVQAAAIRQAAEEKHWPKHEREAAVRKNAARQP